MSFATDSAPAPSAAAFAAALQAEQDTLGAFVSLLREEQEILVRGDAERLALIAPEKAAKINLLTELGEQRNRYLSSQNLTRNAEGMTTWLKRNPSLAASARKIWEQLLACAETAREINQSNGLLIESSLQQNRLRLGILQVANASEGVYRPDGQLRSLRHARSLSQV